METWQLLIKEFDDDLKRRMIVIGSHEVNGINIESRSFYNRLIRHILGFPTPGRFPGWLDHTKYWRNRNRDRVNEVERIRRLKNPEKFRKSCKAYRDRNLEKERIRGRLKYEKRSREEKDRINEKRREKRKRCNVVELEHYS